MFLRVLQRETGYELGGSIATLRKVISTRQSQLIDDLDELDFV